MSDLLVACPCYEGGKNPTGGKPAAVTAQTAEANGIELTPYGMGEQWPGFRKAKLLGFRDAIRKSDKPYVMLCDSQDVIFLHGPEAIIESYEKMGAGVVLAYMTAEWPPGYRTEELAAKGKDQYGMLAFPDDGMVLGTRAHVLDALHQLSFGARIGSHLPLQYAEEALAWWSSYWLSGALEFELDVEEQIGVHTKRGGFDDVYQIDGYELVTPTGTRPHFVHFAGGIAKSKHMPFFYKKMFGKDMP